MTNRIDSLYHPEALRGDRAAGIEAYYLKDWRNYDMIPHRHERMEIMYVLGGCCVIPTEDGDVRLKKGEFIFLDASVAHGLRVDDGPCRIMNVEFSLNRPCIALPLRTVADKHPSVRRLLSAARPWLVFVDTQDVHGVLRRLIASLDEGGEGQPFAAELLTWELVIAIAQLFEEGSRVQPGSLYIRKAMQFMNQNYFRNISIKDICCPLGIAEGYLSRVFKKSCGVTVIDYLTELRIRKAKMLLAKTELPVADIAGSVGVASRTYFNHLFKQRTGVTPSRYRRDCSTDSWETAAKDTSE